MVSTIIGIIVGIILSIPCSIFPTKKIFQPRNEKKFYSLSLIPIAMIYVGFSYYYGDLSAVHAEIVGLIIFLVFALLSQFMTSSILALGYVAHGLWDLFHEILVAGIGDIIPWTQVPTGYAAFCLTYDIIIAIYVWKRWKLWEEDSIGHQIAVPTCSAKV